MDQSVVEDAAEFGYGLYLGRSDTEKIAELMKEAIHSGIDSDIKAAFQDWLDGWMMRTSRRLQRG